MIITDERPGKAIRFEPDVAGNRLTDLRFSAGTPVVV